MESGESVKPKLRGKLLSPVPRGLSGLRGKLLGNPEKFPSSSPPSIEPVPFNVGTTLVQRDDGNEFIIMAIKEGPHGTKVNLRSIDGMQRVTLNKDDLETKLKTEGGPWKIK